MEPIQYSDRAFGALQRTPACVEYDNFRANLRQMYTEDEQFRREAIDSVRAIRSVGPGEVHQNKLLDSMSVMYANGDFIGERLMPVVKVGSRSNSFAKYPKRERFAAPDDRVTERSTPNELSETRTSDNYSVEDYAFLDYVDATTIENEDPIFDELMEIIAYPAEMLALKREKRIAAIVRNTANYAGNVANGTNWLDESAGRPDIDIMTGIEKTFQGRAGGNMLIGAGSPEAINALLRHPRIRALSMYVQAGFSPLRWVANQLGLSDILVGSAREDTATPPATESYSRIWGDDFAIVSVSKNPTRKSAHFGTTFRTQNDPFSSTWFDPKVGKAGGYWGKVGVSEDHKPVAGDTSFLLQTVLS